jgi:RsiW-degrading membrane proteinase PrsW (M82 family)
MVTPPRRRREARILDRDRQVTTVLAVLPVLLFLGVLTLMDSFKLVPLRNVVRALAVGAVAAVMAGAIFHSGLAAGLSSEALLRHTEPLVAECVKAALVTWLVTTRRVGFLVDAAVLGFAVGTGFALIENVAFFRALADAPLPTWLAHTLGTTMMHGGTAAVFAMLGRTLVDRHPGRTSLALLPGLLVAIAVHWTIGQLALPPLARTVVILLVLSLLLVAVFEGSERATRKWVAAGLDLDIELLQLVTSQHFEGTRYAAYLRGLRERFPAHVVADMFCLLRLELELSVQARALAIARDAGLHLPDDEDLDVALGEYEYLRRSIGRTGLLALGPIQVVSGHDHWHRHLLGQARAARARS